MSISKTKKTDFDRPARKDIVSEVVNILESLITAFVLALLFITFVVQSFIIPTGSMAGTLKGAHFRLRCPQCGYKYDHDFRPRGYGLPENAVPRGYVKPPPTRCPSCGHYQMRAAAMPVTRGDIDPEVYLSVL